MSTSLCQIMFNCKLSCKIKMWCNFSSCVKVKSCEKKLACIIFQFTATNVLKHSGATPGFDHRKLTKCLGGIIEFQFINILIPITIICYNIPQFSDKMQVQTVSNIRLPNLKYIHYLILQFIRSFHAISADRPACATETFTKNHFFDSYSGFCTDCSRGSVVRILSVLCCWHYIKTLNICAIS